MSTLISPSNLLLFTDAVGREYRDFVTSVDVANMEAQYLVALNASIFAADPVQQNQWFPFLHGVFAGSQSVGASGIPSSSPFGSSGFAGGVFGAGQELINRNAIFSGGWFANLEGFRTKIAQYAALGGLAITDLNTFAAYYNNLTPYSVLFSPEFAALYYYAYSGKILNAASVFANPSIALGTGTITGTNAVTLSASAATNWPTANGYTTPAPTNTGPGNYKGAWDSGTAYVVGDAVLSSGIWYVSILNGTNHTPASSPTYWSVNTFGNNVYLGAVPMAQAFAPLYQTVAKISVNINGTCALTVTAKNQAGVSKTWTATLDSATAGTSIALTPTTGGDRINSAPTALAVAGTATAGAFTVQSGAVERTVS